MTDLPEEGESQYDLQRCRPQHVQERGEVHKALSVHGHQVNDLSDGGGALRFIGNIQRLHKHNETKSQQRM